MISGIGEIGSVTEGLQQAYFDGLAQARQNNARSTNSHNYDVAVSLERKMFVSQANAWGIAAQRNALMDALRKLNPNHPLLRVNGRDSDGDNRTPLNDLHNTAFDAHLAQWMPGVDPKRHRPYKIK